MGIVEIMQSPAGKRATGVAYSLGASVVIVGALFKIMHWPGAGVMLTVGMATEAILFAIGIFDKPHKDYHWELVWPELDNEEESAEGASAHGIVAAGADNNSKELSIPTVDTKALVEEQLKNLSEGVSKLGNTASQLANLSEAANVSSSYISNVNAASQAAGAFAASQANLKDSSDSLVNSYKDIEASISSASSGSKNFADQMNGINKNISSINSMFEIQAKTANEQGEAMSLVTTALKTVAGSINSSASSAEAYKSEIEKLAQQMKSLNTVYGNMLNAMTIRG
ncbi:MAG: gliding motility protein GldL [Bacteroidales bacterium]|nr:gliding motility protein GldL [Candidatus Scybalocola fimicaballi]